MTTEMTVTREPVGALHWHPDQASIYGAVNGEHDEAYGDLLESVRAHGVLVPIVVAHGTPGLADGTVISGHRRLTAAREVGLTDVPAIRASYESDDHARLGLLEHNRAREKNEWVKTQESRWLYDTHARLAAGRRDSKLRQNAGDDRSGSVTMTERGTARDIVGAITGESGSTVDVRVALSREAERQSPGDPSSAPVAKDLKAGKKPRTVAKKHGVGSAPKPAAKPRKPQAPKSAAPAIAAPLDPADEAERAKAAILAAEQAIIASVSPAAAAIVQAWCVSRRSAA